MNAPQVLALVIEWQHTNSCRGTASFLFSFERTVSRESEGLSNNRHEWWGYGTEKLGSLLPIPLHIRLRLKVLENDWQNSTQCPVFQPCSTKGLAAGDYILILETRNYQEDYPLFLDSGLRFSLSIRHFYWNVLCIFFHWDNNPSKASWGRWPRFFSWWSIMDR